MKRFRQVLTALLVIVLVGSMITITLPASVGATTTPASNWTLGGNAQILSTETWVKSTVVVDLKDGNGYVQLRDKLTELIGENGEDGKGYINIICDDYFTDYAYLQLVGDPAATGINVESDTKAMTWYLKTNGNAASANSEVHLRGAPYPSKIYGIQSQFAAEGFMFAFSKNSTGNVMIRGIGDYVYESFDSYEDTTNITSRLTLSEITGDAEGKTGEDGVYFRLQEFAPSANTNLKYTITVYYTLSAASSISSDATSRWTVGGNAEIISENTMIYDTVEVDLVDQNGYIQHNEKLTQLIGENGEDGEGYINIICDDYFTDYAYLQLVGDPAATGINLESDTKAMTWYLKTNGNAASANSEVHLRGAPYPSKIYGIQSQFAAEGFIFAFSKNSTGNVMIRGIGDYVYETFDSYEDTTNITSRLALREITGDAEGKTGEDGVYFRLQEFTPSANTNLKYTITVAYPEVLEQAEIQSIAPELNDAITVHVNAEVVTDSTDPVRMKFIFKDEEIWVDGIQTGTTYSFALPNILPQDMTENIAAELYIGDTLKDTVSTYSMQQYCMNTLSKTTDEDTELRALLVALLNYGTSAQEYFGKDEINLANSALSDVQKAYLTNWDIGEAEGVIAAPVSGTENVNYKWKAATIGLYDFIKVRFKFTATDIEHTRIQIVGTDTIFDKDDFVDAGNGAYYIYTDGIYATDFATSLKAIFIDSEGVQIGETVEYSVNTYLQYMSNLPSPNSVQPIVQAIYNYGMAAVAYKTAQS